MVEIINNKLKLINFFISDNCHKVKEYSDHTDVNGSYFKPVESKSGKDPNGNQFEVYLPVKDINDFTDFLYLGNGMPACEEDDIIVKKECTKIIGCGLKDKHSYNYKHLTLLDVDETGNGNISTSTPAFVEICDLSTTEIALRLSFKISNCYAQVKKVA